MSSLPCHLESIKKSYNKLKKMMLGKSTTSEKCRAMRPYILKLLRLFDDLEKDSAWNELIQVAYIKTTMEFLPELVHLKQQGGYIKKFENNLLKFKKICEDTSIHYYNYLPGNKLPLDVRSKIISFISPVPMFKGHGKDRSIISKTLYRSQHQKKK
jgi:hypothetical protein